MGGHFMAMTLDVEAAATQTVSARYTVKDGEVVGRWWALVKNSVSHSSMTKR
jgi:hypothetical protein